MSRSQTSQSGFTEFQTLISNNQEGVGDLHKLNQVAMDSSIINNETSPIINVQEENTTVPNERTPFS
jgi:hypothetical protein